MITVKPETQKENDFAEKCRIALEKSYGISFPKPSCLSKKHPKKHRLFGR
jgi:hypothetical protein